MAKLFGIASVKTHYWDSWNLDYTVSHMVLPVLKQLKAEKHGSPHVDQEDVPEELRMSEEELRKYNEEWGTDEKFFDRWEWVMDEMIWAHEQIVDDEAKAPYDHPDYVEHKKYEARKANGFRLFGKYYEALWD